MYKFLLPFLLSLLLSGTLPARGHWADSILTTLTLDQQIGLLFMLAAYSNGDLLHEAALEKAIRLYHPGGLIFFQGTPARQALLTNRYQQASHVPLFVGIDAENGIG